MPGTIPGSRACGATSSRWRRPRPRGIPVKGAFFRSRLDSLEWRKDDSMHLFRIDFAPQECSPTSGAAVFASLGPAERACEATA